MIQLFSINQSVQSMNENIGVARLHTFLKEKNIDSDLTYLYIDKGIEQQSANIKFDIKYYGISLYYCYTDFAFKLCEFIKNINPYAVIFMGGRVVTDAYKIIFNDCQYFDFAVLGHGEATLLYAIKELEKGKNIHEVSSSCKYLASKNDLEEKSELYEDINNLCLPDRTYTKTNLATASICTSHGCGGRCTFCSWKKTNAKWCGRSMRDVYYEIVNIYESTGIRDYSFTDGSFEDPGILGKQRINELCDLLSEYPVKFAFKFYMRAETFKNIPADINLLHKMRNNGFITAYVGIEAGNNDDLIVYNKKAKFEDNEKIIKILNIVDIDALYGFIMINPYSKIIHLIDNYKFLTSHKCHHLFNYVNRLDVYYNTEIYWRIKKDGLLSKDYRYDKPHLYMCQHKNTDDIKIFLNEYFCGKNEIMRKYGIFYNNVDYINFIKATHKEIYDDYLTIINNCYDNIYKELNNYFNILYIENDVLSCINKYDEFCELIDIHYKKVIEIKNKMMRDVIRINRK